MTVDTFQGIIGHEKATRRLKLMLKNDAFPHALLIAGPRHLGKRSLALAAAAGLLGASKLATHPDFRMLERGRDAKTEKLHKQIPIDDVRDLCGHLRMSSFLGGRKVAVIDEAETLSEEAGNALLKTLEEPSAGSHLILIVHDLSSVLATIRSRSAVLTLRRVADAHIAEALAAAGLADADRLTRLSGGRPGLALGLGRDRGMLEWYMDAERRWQELRTAPIHRRFALVADLAPSGGDREETAGRLRDMLGFWEEAARRELRCGAVSAATALRGLFRLRRALDINVQPRLLLERFALELDHV